MATKTSGWKCTHSTSVRSSTDTTVTIRVTCTWKNDGWTYNMGGVSAWVYCAGQSYKVASSKSINTTSSTSASVSLGYHDFTVSKGTAASTASCYAKITASNTYISGTKSSTATSVSVPAKTSYTVSYNANGGSGAPSAQTKWYGTALTLSTTKPTRNGYTFQGWATSSTGSVAYAAGASYTANAAVTLYAVWKANTYTVSYNANGGSGAPASQTKTYGVALTLSSTKPTRTNYNFKGWATSTSGSVAYAAGASYTANAAITLYAVWEVAYVKPRLTNFSAQRCNSAGTISETGTYAKVTFNWATDKTVSSIKIEWKTQSATSWTSATVTASGTSGSVSQVVGAGGISAENSYSIKATVADAGGSTPSPTLSLGTTKFPIDVKNKGTGISFGKVAEVDNVADFGFTPRFQSAPQFMVGGRARTPIQMIPGDANGDGIKMEAEGLIVIGSGGSASTFITGASLGSSGSGETTYLASDHSIYLETNLQNGYANKKEFIYDQNGNFAAPGYVSGNYVKAENNSYIASFRLYKNQWIGFYPTNADAIANSNRKGYIGFNNDTAVDFRIDNEKNGDVILKAKNTLLRPYKRAGDSWEFNIHVSGYVTNSGKDIKFTIPLEYPILGSPTVTVSSVDGYILRQNNKYTHDSASDKRVHPNSYNWVYHESGTAITVSASFTNTTNVVNNSPIGIEFGGKITLS